MGTFNGHVNGADRAVSIQSLPLISEKLNSIRAYGFECRFHLPQFGTDIFAGLGADDSAFTLAAKQVTVPGHTVQEITVNRLNDTVYYPGKIQKEDLKITFDDLYQPMISVALYNWFKKIYDPMTGIMAGQTRSQTQNQNTSNFKATLEIVALDGAGVPVTSTLYYGLWPKQWKAADFNYGTNEFHTIEMSFAYDFVEQAAR